MLADSTKQADISQLPAEQRSRLAELYLQESCLTEVISALAETCTNSRSSVLIRQSLSSVKVFCCQLVKLLLRSVRLSLAIPHLRSSRSLLIEMATADANTVTVPAGELATERLEKDQVAEVPSVVENEKGVKKEGDVNEKQHLQSNGADLEQEVSLLAEVVDKIPERLYQTIDLRLSVCQSNSSFIRS
jgi:hypothetical protein